MSAKPTTIRDIKQNSDILNIIFDFAGKWNTPIPSVCKAWKGGFEKYLFAQWKVLEKVAGPDLLRKMRDVKECNSPRVPIRLFQDLHSLLKEIDPPADTDFNLKNIAKGVMGFGRLFFAKKERGIVASIFLARQKAADNHNRGQLLAHLQKLGQSRPTTFPALVGLRNLVDYKGDERLYLCKTKLTELPAFIANKNVVNLSIHENPYLLSLPIEIMDNQRLEDLTLDLDLYERLPTEVRDHFEFMEKLDKIKIESTPMTSGVSYRFIAVDIRETHWTAINIRTIRLSRSIFYKELSYPAQSTLGQLYQLAYMQRNTPLCREFEKAIVDSFTSLSRDQQYKVYGIVRSLAKNQGTPDAFWNELEDNWGRNHVLLNKGRLADALMYLEKEDL